ncbi:hypothetical protein EDD15DRAFT_1042558 [Pisolithus albus]|nr:hypothetical protein EDD15DRAFT_1042558 [Pisolithus albus]
MGGWVPSELVDVLFLAVMLPLVVRARLFLVMGRHAKVVGMIPSHCVVVLPIFCPRTTTREVCRRWDRPQSGDRSEHYFHASMTPSTETQGIYPYPRECG